MIINVQISVEVAFMCRFLKTCLGTILDLPKSCKDSIERLLIHTLSLMLTKEPILVGSINATGDFI